MERGRPQRHRARYRGSLRFRHLGLALGPAGAVLLILLSGIEPELRSVAAMGGIAWWMAVWWITEAVPLAATALLPLILYPILGIASTKVVAPLFMNNLIFLFLGGFLIALAMERWNLHRRIALAIISLFGGQESSIVIGFMAATAFLSMWISNTATTLMMVPMALSIVERLESDEQDDAQGFARVLLLSIAYSASVGGVATLVGTPPNIAFARIYEQTFPAAPPIEFLAWMAIALPLTLLSLVMIYFVLNGVVFRSRARVSVDPGILAREMRDLGRMSWEEKAVLAVFILTASLWILRPLLARAILPHPELWDDGTVAILMGLTLFVIPARRATVVEAGTPSRPSRILDADVFARIPWGIILLFGGGFALAHGFEVSGLSEFLGKRIASLDVREPIVSVAAIAGGMTFLTELTSNTATTQLILPILASAAVSLQVHPLLFMIPATMAASFAFMMPVATPPNAIVFGSNRLRVIDMVKAGLILNLLGIVMLTALILLLVPLVFGVDLSEPPPWLEK